MTTPLPCFLPPPPRCTAQEGADDPECGEPAAWQHPTKPYLYCQAHAEARTAAGAQVDPKMRAAELVRLCPSCGDWGWCPVAGNTADTTALAARHKHTGAHGRQAHACPCKCCPGPRPDSPR